MKRTNYDAFRAALKEGLMTFRNDGMRVLTGPAGKLAFDSMYTRLREDVLAARLEDVEERLESSGS